jgi:DmsE family decaheme c-type cytochrome
VRFTRTPAKAANASLLALLLLFLFHRPAAGQEQPTPAGAEACIECHESEVAEFSGTKMGKLFLNHPRTAVEEQGCESCHGPSTTHAETGADERGGLVSFSKDDPTPIDARNGMCLACDEESARLFWKGSPHESRGVACADCHRVHVASRAVPEGSQFTMTGAQLKEGNVVGTCAQCHLKQNAQLLRFSHMPLREGKLDCASCHNPHGSPNEKMLKAASVNETCYMCHTEKRGPFLWEHAPVVENCANCHDPHGSNHEKMLVVPKPRLCQQCHIETRHPTNPQRSLATGTRFLSERQCLNCHMNLHGSNHPSGASFTR